MIVDLAAVLGGLVLLILGAEGLVRGSVRVAVGFGMTPLVAGLTVAAFGTSSPELVVSLRAALAGSGGLAAGNVIGSNICNIALILGITAIIRPLRIHAQVIRIDAPVMVAATALLLAFLWNGSVSRLEGATFVTLLIVYTVWSIHYARKTGAGAEEEAQPERPRFVHVLLILGGIAALVVGGTLFVGGATGIARNAGISEAVIGLTMVAAGTSMPEMATSVVAALRNQADVAVGNVVGSNLFNILGILGLTAVIIPISIGDIGMRDFLVLGVASLAVLPLARSGFTLTRLEGTLLVSGYVAYVVYLFLA